jgi:hypothetical protein
LLSIVVVALVFFERQKSTQTLAQMLRWPEKLLSPARRGIRCSETFMNANVLAERPLTNSVMLPGS